ncbi:glycosyltransferase family 4 protein [Candidatus Daviesbacteria bacterium]|nr:glycosyltransferase family 4 protein [Candidatus Daviesbacteria bacterium]
MNIVIDCRMYSESGIGRYIRNLVFQLQQLDQKNLYYLLYLNKEYKTLQHRSNFRKVLADFKWYGVAEQIKLLGLLRSLKPDLVHFPHFNTPFFYIGKYIVTIHDLIHQHFSMKRATTHGSVIYKIKQAGYKIIFKNALFKSAKILVPSQFVKDQLIGDWQVNTEKIIVTPEAVDSNIKYQISKIKDEMVLKKFNIKKPYIFYVGNAHPHKNIEGLIRVFMVLREKYHRLQLVLSGHDHYFWEKIRKNNKHKDIIYTGKINDEELVVLYKNAKCFVMPSFEEGFGIPILEAMACGCCVVSSNKGALSEVGGDAVVYFDPYNAEDMIEKIESVLKSDKLRQGLIKLGYERVGGFSWEKLARQTLEVYESSYCTR